MANPSKYKINLKKLQPASAENCAVNDDTSFSCLFNSSLTLYTSITEPAYLQKEND